MVLLGVQVRNPIVCIIHNSLSNKSYLTLDTYFNFPTHPLK